MPAADKPAFDWLIALGDRFRFRGVLLDQIGDIVAQAYAVVRSAIFRVNLRGVREIQARKRCAQAWDAIGVMQRDDRLRRALAEHPVLLYPVALELRIDALQIGDVLLEQLVIGHRQVRVVLIDIFPGVDKVPALVMVGADQVGVLDDAGERD